MLLTALQALGFDLPPMTEPVRLRNPLVMFIALMFSIGLTATFGAALSFRFLARSRIIATSRLLFLGGINGAIAYVSFVPALRGLGVLGGAIMLVTTAAVIAFFGGRVLSRSSPDNTD